MISLNLNEELEEETAQEDIPENRPDYLIAANQIPEGWYFDLEMAIQEKYFLQILTGTPLSFAIETIEFVSANDAQNYVKKDKQRMNDTGLELRFYEDDPRIILHGVDEGFNWQVKSPCCYSRGVSFSIDNYYIYIFGSQNANWDQINSLFVEQAKNLFSYTGQEIPSELAGGSEGNEAPFPNYFGILGMIFIFVANYQRRRN